MEYNHGGFLQPKCLIYNCYIFYQNKKNENETFAISHCMFIPY
jgi:hypothetical protein